MISSFERQASYLINSVVKVWFDRPAKLVFEQDVGEFAANLGLSPEQLTQLAQQLTQVTREMLRQRHKSRAGHVGPSNRTNFGSAENPTVSTEVVAVEPKLLRLNRRFLS